MTNVSNVAAVASRFFALRPAASLAVHMGTMGTAYSKAKFGSTCKLTGMDILCHEAVRHITVHTKAGGAWSGFTANRIFGVLVGARCWEDDEKVGFYWSDWNKCSHDWKDRIATTLEGAPVRALLTVVDRSGSEKRWRKISPTHWSKGGRRTTTKALLSNLNRSKNYRLFKVSN